MRAVIQRVSEARVSVNGDTVGQIGKGFLILLGVNAGDNEDDVLCLAKKTANLRIFEDDNGKMNRSLADVDGRVLVISNFTLCADCRHGNRPDFFGAEKPQRANELYKMFCNEISKLTGTTVETGVFGADMKVSLLNDGPVTLVIDSGDLKK